MTVTLSSAGQRAETRRRAHSSRPARAFDGGRDESQGRLRADTGVCGREVLEPGWEHIDLDLSIVECTAEGAQLQAVVVANASTWLLYPWQADDWPVVVDSVTHDFVPFLDALLTQDRRRGRVSKYQMDESEPVLLVHWVAVDPFWRGAGLGPAFLCDGVAEWVENPPVALLLKPSPFATESSAFGPTPNWKGPRGGRAALRAVRASWRNAGFRPLSDGVWSNVDFHNVGYTLLRDLDRSTNNSTTRAWLAEARTP